MSGQRSLAAVMFTDAVAFSSHVGRNEEEALRMIEEDFGVMSELCAEHGGQVIKSMGDGMLMLFPSASNATHCALEIQRKLGQRTWTHPGNPLLHRIGIHLCDVLVTENDILGDGVNVAARLEREAPAGGIAMSQATFDVVKAKLPVRANFAGERALRNIAEPVRVWEIPPLFAPTPDQLMEPPKRAGLGSETGGKGNGSLVAALVFVGVCLVSAAVIIAMKSGNAAATSADKPAVEQPVIDEPALPSAPMEPPPVLSPAPRADASDIEPRIDEFAPTTGFGPEEAEELAAYESQRTAVRSTYSFGAMLTWLEVQPWARKPVGRAAIKHWTRLRDLWTTVQSRLDEATAPNPMVYTSPAGPVRIWPLGDGRYGTLNAAGNQRVIQMMELRPEEFISLARLLTSPDDVGVRAFAREFGLD